MRRNKERRRTSEERNEVRAVTSQKAWALSRRISKRGALTIPGIKKQK